MVKFTVWLHKIIPLILEGKENGGENEIFPTFHLENQIEKSFGWTWKKKESFIFSWIWIWLVFDETRGKYFKSSHKLLTTYNQNFVVFEAFQYWLKYLVFSKDLFK